MSPSFGNVVDALRQNDPSLTSLLLLNNSLNDKHRRQRVAKALENTTCPISHVCLAKNQLGKEGIMELLQAVKKTHVEDLDFFDNDIGDEGALELGKCIANHFGQSLKRINLSNNQIGDKGATEIAKQLAKCPKLSNLDLTRNSISCQGAAAIARELLEQSSSSSSLQYLALTHNQIGDEGAARIGLGLASNKSLQKLDLAFNRFGNKGLEGLGQGLCENSTLRVLWVHSNALLTRTGVAAFSSSLSRNTCLESFLCDKYDLRIKFYLYRNRLGLWKLLMDTPSLLPIVLSTSLAKYEGMDLCFDLVRNNPTLFANPSKQQLPC